MFSYTCTAPVNIALIKYWGKRNETDILPINGSISATLDQSQLRAKTTVAISKDFKEDLFWLNGKEESVASPRIQRVLSEVRRRSRKRKSNEESSQISINWKVHISSENNFPTAAGLASSAAGYACLVFALAKAFKVDGEISDIARQGSGSACRSVYGGFVEWEMGIQEDGGDSIAKPIASESHWPNMRILILVVSAEKKSVGSTAGMQTSVKTSKLLEHRASSLVPERLLEMKKAIQERNFHSFAELTMKDSNEMHACCLDTYPPISYMNDTSHEIQKIVHYINDKANSNIVAYTFDAGPNACLYVLEENVGTVLRFIEHCYKTKSDNGSNFLRGLSVPSDLIPDQEITDNIPFIPKPGAVQYVIHTKVGPGPQVLSNEDSLLDSSGLPLLT